ncbi:MAG: hypothetical protein AAFX80_05350 [Cyanobacteria bacterium J06639_18]
MKYNLKFLLLSVSVFIASLAASVDTVLAQSVIQIDRSSQWNIQHQSNHNLIARRNREINAFNRSAYDYWDARVLADYWGQSIDQSKARIGRKIMAGGRAVAILEQFLVDARVQALGSTRSSLSRNRYRFFSESKYNYRDASDLAKFWGDRTPLEAKLRIERNLIMGNDEIIEEALRFARQ